MSRFSRDSVDTLHLTPIPLTPYPLHITPYTLHLTPHTLHFTPYNLHITPYKLHLTNYTLHITPYTLHLTNWVGAFDVGALKLFNRADRFLIWKSISIIYLSPRTKYSRFNVQYFSLCSEKFWIKKLFSFFFDENISECGCKNWSNSGGSLVRNVTDFQVSLYSTWDDISSQMFQFTANFRCSNYIVKAYLEHFINSSHTQIDHC